MLLNNKKNNKCFLTTMDKIKIIISGFPILLTNKILALRDLQMNPVTLCVESISHHWSDPSENPRASFACNWMQYSNAHWWILGYVTPNRQPTFWLHDLCLRSPNFAWKGVAPVYGQCIYPTLIIYVAHLTQQQ